ncbi:hypothetical protein GCM10027446_04930 [Angustibacter peucedani]
MARAQRGLVTLGQLQHAQVSRAAVRWSLGRTTRLVLPRVLALFTGGLDDEQRLVAGCLWAGPRAQVAGLTAARWHGFPDLPDDGLVRLLVDWGSPAGAAFALRRRTTRLDPNPWRRDALVVTSRARAAVDAARSLAPEAARLLVVSGVQRGLVRLDDLRAELEAGPRQGSAAVRRALADAETGGWSLPEVEVLRELARSAVLPRAWPNPRLVADDGTVLPTPDFWLDDVGLAGQVHSRAFHVRDEHWERTVAADTALGEHGVVVLAVTPTGFRRDPAAFRARVERAYLAARRSGRRPAVVMQARQPGVVR